MYVLHLVWKVNPILFDFGSIQIRYYGLLFATGIFIGYLFWRQQMMLRRGYSEDVAEDFVMWGFIAILVGARLGHCLLYDADYFLSHPIEILKVWQGGLASHGATLGLITALFLFHRKHKIPFLDVLDSLTISAAVCGITIRLGNFMNSEIVGRVSDVPWAVKFPLYGQYMYHRTGDPQHLNVLPRHPSQLYEVLMAVIILVVLLYIDKKYQEKRPRGILIGLFFIMYFTGRFIVEYFKEFQTLQEGLTMGQYLSIPFVLVGTAILINSYKRWDVPEIKTEEHKSEAQVCEKNEKNKGKKSKKKKQKQKKNKS